MYIGIFTSCKPLKASQNHHLNSVGNLKNSGYQKQLGSNLYYFGIIQLL